MLSMRKLHKSKRQLVPDLERMAVHAQAFTRCNSTWLCPLIRHLYLQDSHSCPTRCSVAIQGIEAEVGVH